MTVMKIDEFNSLVEDLTKDRKGVARGKRKDYTKGDSDVLKNFKNQAEALGVTPEVSLAVHMEKQFSAVLNYIKTDGQSESEPIIKRIGDTINYLELLWGLINEDEELSSENPKDAELVGVQSVSTGNLYLLKDNPEIAEKVIKAFVTLGKNRLVLDVNSLVKKGGRDIIASGDLEVAPYYE